MIDCRGDKTAQKEIVSGMDLNAVKTGLFCADSRIDKLTDHHMDLICSHIVGLHLSVSAIHFTVKGSKSKLGDDRASISMDNIRQPAILGNQRIVPETHHAVKIEVVESHAGKAGNNGTNAALCQLGINVIGFFRHTSIGICDSFPGCGAYQTVSDR